MNAKDIRKIKVLTDELLKDLISQVHPLIIKKVGENDPKILQITDMTGLRTSHYMKNDLIYSDNQELIDALPKDEIVPIDPVPTPTHKFVDLGLSVRFATQVITDDQGNPLYFQWGDIVGYTEDQVGTDKTFDWIHYKFGTYDNLTKYNDSDHLTTLQPEDDAATQLWSSDWRMPTQAELEELWALPSEWVENYQDSGLNGRVFTGTNGNTLFIPALGYADDSSVSGLGTNSFSWSSSLSSGDVSYAMKLNFSSVKGVVDSDSRCIGFCILPVQNLQ